ncbi:MAG: hypothetical protein AB8B68_04620 [Rickettsiaceae bacterium]
MKRSEKRSEKCVIDVNNGSVNGILSQIQGRTCKSLAISLVDYNVIHNFLNLGEHIQNSYKHFEQIVKLQNPDFELNLFGQDNSFQTKHFCKMFEQIKKLQIQNFTLALFTGTNNFNAVPLSELFEQVKTLQIQNFAIIIDSISGYFNWSVLFELLTTNQINTWSLQNLEVIVGSDNSRTISPSMFFDMLANSKLSAFSLEGSISIGDGSSSWNQEALDNLKALEGNTTLTQLALNTLGGIDEHAIKTLCKMIVGNNTLVSLKLPEFGNDNRDGYKLILEALKENYTLCEFRFIEECCGSIDMSYKMTKECEIITKECEANQSYYNLTQIIKDDLTIKPFGCNSGNDFTLFSKDIHNVFSRAEKFPYLPALYNIISDNFFLLYRICKEFNTESNFYGVHKDIFRLIFNFLVTDETIIVTPKEKEGLEEASTIIDDFNEQLEILGDESLGNDDF